MAKHSDLAIVGGGIIGLTTAYFLAKAGFTVEVIEQGEPGREASWAGAGILPPGNPERAATPVDRLRGIGSVSFPTLSAELREATGIDNGYVRCGAVEFFATGEDVAVLRLWEAEGIRFHRVTRAEVAALGLPPAGVEGPGRAAYHLPDCAQVRNPWHLRALDAACRHRGVRIRCGQPVVGWLTQGRRVEGVRLGSGECVVAGRCLLAGGAWSEPLLRQLGHSPGVHPVRGQIVLLNNPRPAIHKILLFGKRYLVPRTDGRVLVGATEEPEAGFSKWVTPAGVSELLAFARSLFPEWDGAELERTWAGLRPGTPDGLPFLGPIPEWVNVFVATGHFRAGVQLSIGTAQVLTELLTDRPTSVPLDAFSVSRSPQRNQPRAFRS